jgi:hypothetical protein
MVLLAMIGLVFIVISGIINVMELKKFFAALGILNACTRSIKDKCLYPFRLITLLPMLAPLIPDVILMSVGGAVGLGGGPLGAIIGIGGTCMVTLIIKIALKAAKPKEEVRSYTQEIARLRGYHG